MPRAAAIRGQLGYVGLIKPYKGVERSRRRLRRGIRHRSGPHPPDRGQADGTRPSSADCAPHRAAQRARDDAGVRRRGRVRRRGHVERARRAAVPVHAQLGNRAGGTLARAPRARARQRPQSRLSSEVGPGLGAPVRRRAHRRRAARRRAGGGRAARGGARPQRSRVGTTPAPATPAPTGWPWAVAAADRRIRGVGDVAGGAGAGRAPRTRRRHPDLPPAGSARERALSAVREQVDAENGAPEAPMRCSILVIDNDPGGSGGRSRAEHGATVRGRATTGHRGGPQSGARGVRRRAARCSSSTTTRPPSPAGSAP